MITFKEFLEGVNPTDFDSAGKDQDPENYGIPYHDEEMKKLVDKKLNRKKTERGFADQIAKEKPEETDPNKLDPTAPAKKDYIKDNKLFAKYLDDSDKALEDEDKIAKEVPVKTTRTMFRYDREGQYSPRGDTDDVQADKSNPVAKG